MRKGKFYSKAVFFISIVLVPFLFTVGAAEGEKDVSSAPQCGGSDLVLIGAVDSHDLQRSPVVFLHGRHTESLLKFGRDCTSCHMTDGDHLSNKFNRLVDIDHKMVMQTYHTNCIGCHTDMKASKEQSGPVTCGGCHDVERQKYESFWEAIRFDKSLHYRHIKSNEEKCEFCHHEYDKEAKKLIYKKGKENPCSYCHGKTTVETAASFREVSHFSCIGCHMEKTSNNIDCGPVKCVGCHDAQSQDAIKKLENIPRIKRGQPNEILIKTGEKKVDNNDDSTYMSMVPFNHEAHEQENGTCIVCHHASLESCIKCHTTFGDDDGKHVKLVDAMHSSDSESSCIGCHRLRQKEAECAGCHDSVNMGKRENHNLSCGKCHIIPKSEESTKYEDEDLCQSYAENLLNERIFELKVYNEEFIPETVSIASLEDQYKTVIFPHKKIVLSLLERIKNSKLVAYFHCDEGTLCLGCHHNSPTSEKPPSCGNCHADKVNVSVPFKPGLVAAYHQKCIGCHNAMGLEKPDSRNCDVCHEKKDFVS